MTFMFFSSSLVAFASFVLLLLHWDVTFGSTFGAVWQLRAIFLEVSWLSASEAHLVCCQNVFTPLPSAYFGTLGSWVLGTEFCCASAAGMKDCTGGLRFCIRGMNTFVV